MTKWVALLLALALNGATSDVASAQSDYPNRPIRIVVPYAAGGSADILARLIAAGLQTSLGQSVLVENRSGASGNVGTVAVAKSPADGYTLLVNTSSFIVNPSLFKPPPFDPIADFVPIRRHRGRADRDRRQQGCRHRHRRRSPRAGARRSAEAELPHRRAPRPAPPDHL